MWYRLGSLGKNKLNVWVITHHISLHVGLLLQALRLVLGTFWMNPLTFPSPIRCSRTHREGSSSGRSSVRMGRNDPCGCTCWVRTIAWHEYGIACTKGSRPKGPGTRNPGSVTSVPSWLGSYSWPRASQCLFQPSLVIVSSPSWPTSAAEQCP